MHTIPALGTFKLKNARAIHGHSLDGDHLLLSPSLMAATPPFLTVGPPKTLGPTTHLLCIHHITKHHSMKVFKTRVHHYC